MLDISYKPVTISRSINGTVTNQVKVLSIIVPVYNEEKSVITVLDRIEEVMLLDGIIKEVIIVNDFSTDRTDKLVRDYILDHPEGHLIYFSHERNQGKGAAIHTGLDKATGDYIIVQDADLEYDPSEYNTLLAPIVKGMADVVYGSRFMGGSAHRILFFWHSIGNRFLTFLSNLVLNQNLTDMETGFKVFSGSIIRQISLKEKRFGFEPEITAKVSKISGVRVYEVGISYYGRTYKEGKKIKWRDGFQAIFCILKYAFVNVRPNKEPQQANVKQQVSVSHQI